MVSYTNNKATRFKHELKHKIKISIAIILLYLYINVIVKTFVLTNKGI